MRDVFLLYRSVDRHLLQLFFRDELLTHCQRNRFLQQINHLFGPHTMSSFDERSRMQRQFVLHRGETAEVLPVRIFDPTCDHQFVRLVEGMLQTMQADQQPRGFCGCSVVRAITISERPIEPLPIDFIRQHHKRVIWIENLVEVSLKEIELIRFGTRARLHK